MDIEIVSDTSFNKFLNQESIDFLKSLLSKHNYFNYEEIKNVFLNNNIATGIEGNVYYEIKNKNFISLSTSIGNSVYIDGLEEVKQTGINKELLSDHTMCVAFVSKNADDDNVVNSEIKETLKDFREYINKTPIHQEVIYFNIGPNGFVPPHRDGLGNNEFYTAVINLNCPENSAFITIDNRTVQQRTGEIFLFDTQEVHSAINYSKTENWEFLTIRLI
jgi:hypothetical protein